MKFPVGIQTFETIRKGGYAYVDKTGLVYKLANNGQMYFFSRPRRFGKSLLVSTLSAYFSGRRDLFEGLAMEGLETAWDKHVVLHLDFSDGDYTRVSKLEEQLTLFVTKCKRELGIETTASSPDLQFSEIIEAAQKIYRRGVVVLIDEYDKPLLDVLGLGLKVVVDGNERSLEDFNRGLLKGFYAVLKKQERNLRFVLLTGVTKFAQVSVFSGLNSLNDVSMDARYETLCGITPRELEGVFGEEMDEMAAERGWTPESLRDKIRRRYDGYHFSEAMTDVYNPFSLVKALDSRKLDDYWFKTGTPTYLVRLLRGSGAHLSEFAGCYYRADMFEDYRADVERPLPMIFQSGYLTIKDYDDETETFLLDFPNDEVRRGFLPLVADNFLGVGDKTDPAVMQMSRSLRMGDFPGFMTTLTAFLASVPYTMRRKDSEPERERYFQYTFYLVLRLLGTYIVDVEVAQSQGRVDCVLRTKADAYVVEFKLDGTADEALRQIAERGYARPYDGGALRVHRVGVSFSSETGTIGEWREA